MFAIRDNRNSNVCIFVASGFSTEESARNHLDYYYYRDGGIPSYLEVVEIPEHDKVKNKPAEVFPLCDYLQEEMFSRNLSYSDLAKNCVLSEDRLRQIIVSGHFVNFREAEALAYGFGVSPIFLLNIQLIYLKSLDKR